MNPETRVVLLRKLVAVARAVVTYEVGLPVGCLRLRTAASSLKHVEPLVLPAVDAYLEAIRVCSGRLQGLPIGADRLDWDRAVLRARDPHLEAINREHRDRVFDACYDLIDRFAAPPPSAPPTP